jgi:DUF4097 and DUF4098 domain-containing protein YvlB
MNKVYAILMLGMFASQVQAQKIIEKQVPLQPGADVKLDLQITDSINVQVWDKNEVYVKASIDIDSNKNNEDYHVTFGGTGDKSFEVNAKLEHAQHSNCNCSCRADITFTVYVPKGVNLNVNTINGDITIRGGLGQVKAKTISGFVDMAVSPERKASLEMSTISGNVYSNLDFPLDKTQPKQVGGHINTNLNGGGDISIVLESISGDIYCRKG